MQRVSKHLEWVIEAWQLIKPYWKNEEKYKGLFWLCIILGNSLFEVYMSVRLNKWNGTFFNTIQNYDKTGFLKALLDGSMIMGLYVFTMTIGYYFRSVLEINWRKWLTTYYLNNWFHSKAYYKSRFTQVNQDNPDQRISEDIHQFVQLILRLSIDFFRSCTTLGSFIVILWSFSGNYKFILFNQHLYIPGYMVWMALLYAFIGTYITFKIGYPLININYQQQMYEADFRYNLVRVREYADQVVAYGGESVEKKVVTKDFDNIVANFMQSINRNLKINLFNYAYGQLSTIVPSVISAGRYFAHQITLGDMMQINSAFARVEFSIAYFVYVYSDIANLRSIMMRMHGFNQVINSSAELKAINQSLTQTQYLVINKLDVNLPNGQCIISDFSLVADAGERILFKGNSGCGKSTILKVINGLWPYATGKIWLQDGLSSLFISQKPYLPKVNLKEAICYPKAHNLPSDNEVCQILHACGLNKFCELLYQEHDWSSYLSLGEQQKIAFCRVLINKPDILYLDEITAALDPDAELALYQLIIEKLPKSLIISVGHRATLEQLHLKIINLSTI